MQISKYNHFPIHLVGTNPFNIAHIGFINYFINYGLVQESVLIIYGWYNTNVKVCSKESQS